MKTLSFIPFLILLGPVAFAESEGLDPRCSGVQARVEEGDLIFTGSPPQRPSPIQILSHTWVDHVGIVTWSEKLGRWNVLESIFPWSREVELCDFITRAQKEEVVLRRLKAGLDRDSARRVVQGARKHLGELYDPWFDWDDTGWRYCTKFVSEAYREATGRTVGELRPIRQLVAHAMQSGWIGESHVFWGSLWFGGEIPTRLRTVTPRSQLEDPDWFTVFEWLPTPGRVPSK